MRKRERQDLWNVFPLPLVHELHSCIDAQAPVPAQRRQTLLFRTPRAARIPCATHGTRGFEQRAESSAGLRRGRVLVLEGLRSLVRQNRLRLLRGSLSLVAAALLHSNDLLLHRIRYATLAHVLRQRCLLGRRWVPFAHHFLVRRSRLISSAVTREGGMVFVDQLEPKT